MARHHGNMMELTPIAVIPHQHHLILQIIDLNPQTESVVLKVKESLDEFSTYIGNPIPLTTWLQEASLGGMWPVTCFMTVVSCSTLPIFVEYISVND